MDMSFLNKSNLDAIEAVDKLDNGNVLYGVRNVSNSNISFLNETKDPAYMYGLVSIPGNKIEQQLNKFSKNLDAVIKDPYEKFILLKLYAHMTTQPGTVVSSVVSSFDGFVVIRTFYNKLAIVDYFVNFVHSGGGVITGILGYQVSIAGNAYSSDSRQGVSIHSVSKINYAQFDAMITLAMENIDSRLIKMRGQESDNALYQIYSTDKTTGESGLVISGPGKCNLNPLLLLAIKELEKIANNSYDFFIVKRINSLDFKRISTSFINATEDIFTLNIFANDNDITVQVNKVDKHVVSVVTNVDSLAKTINTISKTYNSVY